MKDMDERKVKYIEWMKRNNNEYMDLETAYKNVVAWLAFSALLNVWLLASWLIGVGQ